MVQNHELNPVYAEVDVPKAAGGLALAVCFEWQTPEERDREEWLDGVPSTD